MLAAEIIKQYVAGQREFVGEVDFQRVNFPRIDLSDIRLTEPIFSGANLPGANLRNAYLQYAHIDLDCNLAGSNMSYVNLNKSRISTANLSNVILDNADLNEAEIVDVNLSFSNLNNTNLKNTLFNCVDLTNTSLSETQISEAKMRGSNLVLNKCQLNGDDLEILNRLRNLSNGRFLFSSEGEENMSAFVWKIPGKNKFDVNDIISMGKYNESTEYKIKDIRHFHYTDKRTSWDAIRHNDLIEIFRNELENFNIYWLEERIGDYVQQLDVYGIGKTKNGSFAGVAVPHISWSLEDVH